MDKKYIKILGIQLETTLDCNERDEYLIETEKLYEQMQTVKNLIEEKNPDVVALPEMSYMESLEEYYKKISQNKLIIAGSIYKDGINYTVVFQNKKKHLVKKYNASGSEPMIRYQEGAKTDNFIKEYLEEHLFEINNKKILVLNCMEYYQHAYTIARENPNLFGIICICSNSNQKVFIEESKALHNHCENIYSFVINCISTYQNESYAKGESYVFGPIQYHEQDWLKKSGFKIDKHTCSILMLDNKPGYFYGEFTNNFSRFGRSDYYVNNPKNMEVGKLMEGKNMKKNIIITSGPTNERLDAVMKITNMSTGALGAIVADELLETKGEDIEKIYYVSPKLARKPKLESDKLELITIESAEDLLKALKELLLSKKIDTVVHSAAVGDYLGEYAITAKMLANEIAEKTYDLKLSREDLEEFILGIIRNPEQVVSDEHKISSYESDLMFKLNLTPKVISSIKETSPNTQLIGFKLLDGVPYEELINVASRLREKNKADYIIANDLSTIGNGKHKAYFVSENGVEHTCETKTEIAKTLIKVIFK